MARIVFYTHAPAAKLQQVEFYKQDIEAIKKLGHEVVVCTKVWQIPLRFDAMFIWWWTHASLPVFFCRLLKRPCIVTGTFNFRFPDTFDGTDYFRRPFWQRQLIRFAVKHCTLNLFVSQLELQQCTAYFKLKNAGYMPHCVDDDYLKGAAAERRSVLLNLAWSGRQNLARKGLPELLKAIRLLKDRQRDVHLYLAGLEGDGRPDLLRMIQELDLTNEVHYLGGLTREEKIRMLRESEIYVHPSHYEGFGLAILESMGCGGCVIVRDVGAVREVVGDCGIYISSSDPYEIASAIENVMDNENVRREMQAKAAKRASTMFTFHKKVQTLNHFFRDIQL